MRIEEHIRPTVVIVLCQEELVGRMVEFYK